MQFYLHIFRVIYVIESSKINTDWKLEIGCCSDAVVDQDGW